MKQTINNSLSSLFGAMIGSLLTAALLFGIHAVFAAPTQAPPNGNPAFPLTGPTGPAGNDSMASTSYVGSCTATTNSTCKCNNGERIMVMTAKTAGNTGYCDVTSQNSASVQGRCDAWTAGAGATFACFR